MKIPPYWSRAQGDELTALGWSFASAGEARAMAEARLRRMRDKRRAGEDLERYGYHDQPVREEIVHRFEMAAGASALITRNRYGALVLNTPSVFFADLDYPPEDKKKTSGGLLKRLFGGKPEPETAAAPNPTQQRVQQWTEVNPDRTFRLYRTRAGLRLMLTDRLYEPAADETLALLKELGSDRLYITLTQKQECFRARLTPKPWRIGVGLPHISYPYHDAAAEQRMRKWEQAYERRAADHRACVLLTQRGDTPADPTIAEVVRLHDRHACGAGEQPLA